MISSSHSSTESIFACLSSAPVRENQKNYEGRRGCQNSEQRCESGPLCAGFSKWHQMCCFLHVRLECFPRCLLRILCAIITTEAINVVAKATEHFLEYFARECHEVVTSFKKKTITPQHFGKFKNVSMITDSSLKYLL
jgi:hypothetical protein